MPILTLEVVGEFPPRAAQQIANAAAPVFGVAKPRGVWVKILPIALEHYAENSDLAPTTAAAPCRQPVFISVQWTKLPMNDKAALARLATELAALAAQAVLRSVSEVQVIFEPPLLGRVAFGGVLKE